MTLLHIVTVALVQGITEFLPISSQAHLILVPHVTGWCDQGLVVDIAVHAGTLLAVMTYFWRDCLGMIRGGGDLARGRMTPEGRLLAYILVASIPVLAVGGVLRMAFGFEIRSIAVIGWTTLGFGLALWAADRWNLRCRGLGHMNTGAALVIGLAQVAALLPGTSRSGVTMTAARMLGFERTDAARFSLLMAVPVILAAALLAGLEIARVGDPLLTASSVLAALLAFAAALAAIAGMMRWLRHASFAPFVVYRVVLGLALLAAVYGFNMPDGLPASACSP